LVVSLVMLVAITLIGVFAMSSSRLEWLMSSNSRFQTDSELRAEVALQEGEDAAAAIADPGSFDWTSNDAYYSNLTIPDSLSDDPRDIANWDAGAFHTLNAVTVGAAEYLVEYMGCSDTSGGGCGSPCPAGITCLHTYRIWAHAADGKGAGRIVQSTYAHAITQSLPLPPAITNKRVGFAEIGHD
jgi:Tfp pilus assembly protein PilX